METCTKNVIIPVEKYECVDRNNKFSLKKGLFHLLPFVIVFLLFFIPSILFLAWGVIQKFSIEFLVFLMIFFCIVTVAALVSTVYGKITKPDKIIYNILCGISGGVGIVLVCVTLALVLGILLTLLSGIVTVFAAVIIISMYIAYSTLYIVQNIIVVLGVIAGIALVLAIDAIIFTPPVVVVFIVCN